MNDTKKPENPKAFPNTDPNYFGANDSHGMDLRDYFAAKAMQGFIPANSAGCFGGYKIESNDINNLAKLSYEIADAMLKQREIYNQK